MSDLICVDCAMFHANGDLPDMAGDERIAEITSSDPFVVGDHYGFSWSKCDACGSRSGGDRFEASVILYV